MLNIWVEWLNEDGYWELVFMGDSKERARKWIKEGTGPEDRFRMYDSRIGLDDAEEYWGGQ